MDVKHLHKWFIQNREAVKVLGEVHSDNGRIPIGILQDARRKGLWLMGVAGSGKSYNIMRKMALEDIRAGKAVIFIDPFGNIVESMIPELTKNFGHKLVYLNTGDIKNVLGIPNKEDFKEMFKSKYVFLADLEQGKIGFDKAKMYGEVILERILAAAQELFNNRKDVYVYIDELPMFQEGCLRDMLNQSERLYLNLVVANQFMDQVDQSVLTELVGKMGTKLLFKLSEQDRQWFKDNVSAELADKIAELQENEFVLDTELETGTPLQIIARPLDLDGTTHSAEHQSD